MLARPGALEGRIQVEVIGQTEVHGVEIRPFQDLFEG